MKPEIDAYKYWCEELGNLLLDREKPLAQVSFMSGFQFGAAYQAAQTTKQDKPEGK